MTTQGFPLLQLKLLLELFLAPIMILIPRNRRKVVFGAWKGKQFACNPKYLCQYVAKRGGFTCVWIGNKELESSVNEIPGVIFAQKGSFKAFWHAITAWTYVFNIMWEDDIIRFPRYGRVNLIYVTHGYLDKKVGKLQYNGNGVAHKKKKRFQFIRDIQWAINGCLYSTESWCSECSSLSVNLMLEAQQVHLVPEKMLRYGHPRSDFFYNNAHNESLKQKMRDKYAQQLRLPLGKKWYLFVPTWRHEEKYLYSFSTSKRIEEISKVLESKNAILIEKLHPIVLETMNFKTADSNIRSITRDEARLIDTQELLMACDCVITDYSSVYFDFVLLDRPVIHYVYDYDHFMNKDMGFCYDFKKYGGGPFAYSEDELIEFLKMTDDELLAKRNAATKNELLEYVKGNACENYYKLLEKFASSKKYFVE